MRLTWKINIDCQLDTAKFRLLSTDIFREFCIYEDDDIELKENISISSPSAFKFDFISPIDLSIFYIRIINQSSVGSIKIQFSFLKLLIISMLLMILGSLGHIIIGLLGFLISMLFFGSMTLFTLYMNKEKIENKIKTICQQAV